MNENEKRALSVFDAASKRVAGAKPNDNASENDYAAAYKVLVALGLRSRLRKKYR